MRWCSRHMWLLPRAKAWNTEAVSALLLAKNFDWSCQLLRIFYFFKKEQKYFYFTLAAREVTQTPVVSFTVFFSSLFTNKMFVSVGINWKQIQWRQDWLEVVSGSIEQNYNYLLLHLVMWPPVPGVNLLLSPVSAQPNTAKLLKWGQRSGLGKA